MSAVSEQESEARFSRKGLALASGFIGAVIGIVGATIYVGGVLQQVKIDTARLDRIEQGGSPPLISMKATLDEIARRLEKQDADAQKRLDALDLRANRAIENSEKVHGVQDTHLHAIDGRLDRLEILTRAANSDVLTIINDKLAVITARIADAEAAQRAVAKEVITTVADRVAAIDKRLAVTEQMIADIRTRVDGYTRQQELMLRDIERQVTRQPMEK